MGKKLDELKKAAAEAAKQILGAKDAKDALRQSTIGKGKGGKQ